MRDLPQPLMQDDSIRSPKLRELVNALRDAVAEGMIAGPGIDIIDNVVSAWDVAAGASQSVLWDAIVDSYTQVGSNKQWVYQVREVEQTTVGYGGWSIVSGGRSGDAYSECEDGNGATGLMHNGVNTANLTGTYSNQPIPVGSKVTIKTKVLASGATVFWIIGQPNGVDGACP